MVSKWLRVSPNYPKDWMFDIRQVEEICDKAREMEYVSWEDVEAVLCALTHLGYLEAKGV